MRHAEEAKKKKAVVVRKGVVTVVIFVTNLFSLFNCIPLWISRFYLKICLVAKDILFNNNADPTGYLAFTHRSLSVFWGFYLGNT